MSGVRDLVVCGLIASGAVLSTVRQGADMDYRLTVGAARRVCGLGGRYSGRVDGIRCCSSRRASVFGGVACWVGGGEIVDIRVSHL